MASPGALVVVTSEGKRSQPPYPRNRLLPREEKRRCPYVSVGKGHLANFVPLDIHDLRTQVEWSVGTERSRPSLLDAERNIVENCRTVGWRA